MKRICPCFTPSRIVLAESARESVSSVARYAFNLFFFSQARDFMKFTLYDFTDFYVERGDSPYIKLAHYNKLAFMFS